MMLCFATQSENEVESGNATSMPGSGSFSRVAKSSLTFVVFKVVSSEFEGILTEF